MSIEELSFKNRKELANLNELDLLEIIEFLQQDRKQWINEYTRSHNDYVKLQNNWNELKEWLKDKLDNEKGSIDGKLTTGEYIELQLVWFKMQEIESRK